MRLRGHGITGATMFGLSHCASETMWDAAASGMRSSAATGKHRAIDAHVVHRFNATWWPHLRHKARTVERAESCSGCG